MKSLLIKGTSPEYNLVIYPSEFVSYSVDETVGVPFNMKIIQKDGTVLVFEKINKNEYGIYKFPSNITGVDASYEFIIANKDFKFISSWLADAITNSYT